MKKFFVFFFTFIISIQLIGCGLNTDIPVPTLPVDDSSEETAVLTEAPVSEETSAEPAAEPAEETAAADEADSAEIIIKISDTEATKAYAPDNSGRLILSYLCESPFIFIDGASEASDAINDYFYLLEEECSMGAYGYDAMLQSAYMSYQGAYDNGADLDSFEVLEFNRKIDVVRADSSIICFKITDFINTGREKTDSELYVTFSFLTGELIAGEGEAPSFEAESLSSKSRSGVVSVSETSSGLDIIDKVDCAENGSVIFVNISGTVYDFRISSCQYSDADSTFYDKSLIWTTNYITDGAVQLSAVIPEGMPGLKISYYADGVEQVCLLASDGVNGGAALVSTDISAVG